MRRSPFADTDPRVAISFVLLLAVLVVAQESADPAEEGLHVILVMLVVGLTFLAVVLLGQLSRYVVHRRRERRDSQQRPF